MNTAARVVVARLREPIRWVLELSRRHRYLAERVATMTNAELEAFLKSKSHA